MDIAARKIELVDWLLEINDESKLEKILALRSVLDKDLVADSTSDYPVDQEGYINRIKETDARILLEKHATIEDLEIKNYTKDKLGTIAVSLNHKNELDKRLESYRENPQDLLDWDAVKDEW